MRKLSANLARRQRNFEILSERLAIHPKCFTLPRTTPGIETGWHMYPILIDPASGIRRSHFQQFMEGKGVDTRMVWSGNITRQPAFRDRPMRVDPAGLPNADHVMEWGLILPMNHALEDDAMNYIADCADAYVRENVK